MSMTKLSLSAPLLALLALCGCASVSDALDGPPPVRDEASTSETDRDTETGRDDASTEDDSVEAQGGQATDESKAPGKIQPAEGSACEGGVVLDDGTLETGYGFVPSAAWGQYLQAYDAADFASRKLDTVCVCWLRTRNVDRVEFDVVFHRDAGGRPAAEPYATRSGVAEAVPRGKEAGGRFYAVDVDGVEIPEGVSYVGVRYDPGAANFFFVCADQSPDTTAVPVFQQEDRSAGLAPVIGSRDPIFRQHGAMMLRIKPKDRAAASAGDDSTSVAPSSDEPAPASDAR